MGMTMRGPAATPADYVRCRTYGHGWDDVPVTSPSPVGYTLWLRCVRCHTMRIDVLNPNSGELAMRHYNYPDGYQRSRDEPTITKDQWRLQLIGVLEGVSARRARRATALP